MLDQEARGALELQEPGARGRQLDGPRVAVGDGDRAERRLNTNATSTPTYDVPGFFGYLSAAYRLQ